MRLLKLNKYADFTSFENTWEELGERFEEALKDHTRKHGEVDDWEYDYPGLAEFYDWFQKLYTSAWRDNIDDWRKMMDKIEPELDIEFGDQFTNILDWLEDKADKDAIMDDVRGAR